MRINLIHPIQVLSATISGRSYPVIKAGQGIPCLLIGLGSLCLRTLSENFSSIFEIYSSDLYWVEKNALDDSAIMTLESIIDDIKTLGDELNLKRYIIFAHSAFGIFALEFAKKYPNIAAGIILVGTPVNSNPEVAKKNESIFQSIADEQRKLIDAERKAVFQKEDLSKLSFSDCFVHEYVYRDTPRYWHVPDFNCADLWQGIAIDKLLLKLFTDVLPKIDVLNGLEKITTPVFIAAGMSDYDCCPWLWNEVPNLPKNFTVSIFNKSGHWPHYEESALFDNRLREWVIQYFSF